MHTVANSFIQHLFEMHLSQVLDKNCYFMSIDEDMRNRFKELDLIDRVPDELWTVVRDIVQETGIQIIPNKKKCKKAKWLSQEAIQIVVKRSKKQRRKGKIYPFECRVPKNSKER